MWSFSPLLAAEATRTTFEWGRRRGLVGMGVAAGGDGRDRDLRHVDVPARQRRAVAPGRGAIDLFARGGGARAAGDLHAARVAERARGGHEFARGAAGGYEPEHGPARQRLVAGARRAEPGPRSNSGARRYTLSGRSAAQARRRADALRPGRGPPGDLGKTASRQWRRRRAVCRCAAKPASNGRNCSIRAGRRRAWARPCGRW